LLRAEVADEQLLKMSKGAVCHKKSPLGSFFGNGADMDMDTNRLSKKIRSGMRQRPYNHAQVKTPVPPAFFGF